MIGAVLIGFCLLPATAWAVDLRGRIDARNPQSGATYPVPNAQVQLLRGQTLLMTTHTGTDGFYYFYGVGAGSYQISVNGAVLTSVTVQPGSFQDIPPILVP
jgi:hypothetical protein